MGKWVYVDSDDVHGNMVHIQLKPGTDFVYTVSGDAMEPEYWDGDKVLATVTKEIDFGDVGIFLAGAEYIMREYGPGGLYAKNPNYPILPAAGCQLVGKVVQTLYRL